MNDIIRQLVQDMEGCRHTSHGIEDFDYEEATKIAAKYTEQLSRGFAATIINHAKRATEYTKQIEPVVKDMADKLQSLHNISTYVFENTESWEIPDGPPEASRTFGVELAYLFYAIIKDEPYEAASESRLLELLRECAPSDHELWKQIQIPEIEP